MVFWNSNLSEQNLVHSAVIYVFSKIQHQVSTCKTRDRSWWSEVDLTSLHFTWNSIGSSELGVKIFFFSSLEWTRSRLWFFQFTRVGLKPTQKFSLHSSRFETDSKFFTSLQVDLSDFTSLKSTSFHFKVRKFCMDFFGKLLIIFMD